MSDIKTKKANEYVNQQKKMIIKLILFLLLVIGVILIYQLMEYNKSSNKKKYDNIEQNSIDINNKIQEISVKEDLQSNIGNEIQQQILSGIKSQLPQKIDSITKLQDAEFIDNILSFKIVIDGSNISTDDRELLRSAKLNSMLQGNKPIACSLMNNISHWDKLWKIRYSYSLSDEQIELGHTTFSNSDCN